MLKWFSKLKIAHKLMLMSIFFLLPDSIMLSMMLLDINSDIRFARQEIRGNAYLRPLVPLLKWIPKNQRQTAAGAPAEAIAETDAQIEIQLHALEEVYRAYGQDLQFTDAALSERGRSQARPEFLIADWDKIRGSRLTPDATTALYAHLLDNVHAMIAHAGDMSNLILDPDLDSYYLMDTVLLSLPQAQDELSRAIDDGKMLLTSPSPQLAAPLAALHAQILRDSALNHVANSVNTSLREHTGNDKRSIEFHQQMAPAMDRYLTAVNAFIDLTQRLGNPAGAPISPAEYAAAGSSARSANLALWEVASDQLDVLLQARIDGLTTHREIAMSITAMAVLMASLLVTFINRSINRPLQRQAADLREANTALSAEVRQRMEAQAKLVEASRRAGMAEIAVGVLHNVGNVLNSVNASSTVIREKLDQAKIPLLAKTAALIQDYRTDSTRFFAEDPKGRNVPDLLLKLCDVMANDSIEISSELTLLDRNLDHIKHIVRSQQSFAKEGTVLEKVSVGELIEDAVRINGLTGVDRGVEVARTLQPCPSMLIDKHKVMQILVNLIGNAKRAVIDSPVIPKRIGIQLQIIPADKQSLLRITVTDNGVGIAPENLGKIFQHGFTTRKDGHGFGLHSAAIDAHQMGGAINVSSQGPGKGAQFTFEVPAPIDQPLTGAPL
jgi:two-component system NtrC family sensor kinase